MPADHREPATGTSARERGSVTAEFAVVLPVVLLALLSIVAVGVLGAATVRVQQAAGAVAREAARGGPTERAASFAGDGAAVSVQRSGEWAQVTVTSEVPLWGLLGPSITVSGEAAARVEAGLE
ncbi:TadE family type IV pilus minor pilin [Galactobacter valiniphilus]|uniref:TadE family type IV pilus minor pilin n=1 Tax=Galactobacter valiniphilus TaxID=2676122 RepID=UPI00373663A7